ncbi:MFS transporter [Methanocella arvoryzae]|uniref:Permease (Major facilitator superfamily) n=1 Tax=Methanocella arvoryzae (strain DSM 22066 / NBRC 105507 / MRE50) TaxID=351160 RepID=Q0W692_METAR|nr:MFS transporter [Methanocella arvoryzae]CAH04841.1 permease of the major facilitator superfamily similar to fosmidomycin resistance protein (YfnC) [uncultured archaeon]CAJ36101.1 putative permease (major facilitator superfamily) [Methanocella arvoryzae MRE50]
MSDEKFDKLRVSVLALGHMVNDCYSNVVPPLLPLLQAAYGLTYTLSGVIMTVYTFTSSIIQPIFGYFADRYGRRWMVALSVLWISFFMSMIGVVGYLGLDPTGSYIVILALVAMAGFGSSAYHPQASAMVPRISGDHKGFGVSVFSAGGNLGYAIMPILVVPVTAIWGLGGVMLLFIPGLLMALILHRYAPEAPVAASPPTIGELWRDIRSVALPLTKVTGVVTMRAWLFFGLITFLPSFLMQYESHEWASMALSVTLFCGAVGTLLGGTMSDRYGRKFTIVSTLMITGPLLLCALLTHGYLQLTFFALAGLALLASFSPAVLIAQGLIPKNQGMASGIVLGFAIGIGGLGVSVTGAIADASSITIGMLSLVLLPIAAFLIALLLPGNVRPEKARVR